MPQMGPDTELIVVDNGSTEALKPVLERWPALNLVCEVQKGAAPARNRGVSETSAPALLFLDSDCVPDDDWLTTAHALAEAPLADIMGGAIRVFDETPGPRSGAEALETVFSFNNRHYVEAKGFSVTANLLTRRDVFVATGPFRPGLSEDLDWCHRARALGYRIAYAESLRVRHPTRSDWTALARKWQRLTLEEYHLKKDGAWARVRWGVKALAMPFSVLPHGLNLFVHPGLAGTGERLRGLAMLVRLRVMRLIWMLRVWRSGSVG